MSLARRAGAFAVAVVVACTSVHAADESYAIKLDRPSIAGSLADIHSVVERTRTTTTVAPGAAAAPEVRVEKWDFTSRMEVLEVDPRGAATRCILTVKKLTDGTGADLVPPGSEIKISRSEKEVAIDLIGGGTLSDAAKAAFQLLFTKLHPDAPNEDEALGSPLPHKVGDSWGVDSAKVADNLKANNVGVAAHDVSGKVTVKSHESPNGVSSLRLVVDMNFANAQPVTPTPSWTVESWKVSDGYEVVLPVDPSLPMMERNKHTVTVMQLVRSDGAKVESKEDYSSKVTITPIKAGQ